MMVSTSPRWIPISSDGVRQSARLENNVYFFEGDTTRQLVIHFRDGSTKSVVIPTVSIPSGTG